MAEDRVRTSASQWLASQSFVVVVSPSLFICISICIFVFVVRFESVFVFDQWTVPLGWQWKMSYSSNTTSIVFVFAFVFVFVVIHCYLQCYCGLAVHNVIFCQHHAAQSPLFVAFVIPLFFSPLAVNAELKLEVNVSRVPFWLGTQVGRPHGLVTHIRLLFSYASSFTLHPCQSVSHSVGGWAEFSN